MFVYTHVVETTLSGLGQETPLIVNGAASIKVDAPREEGASTEELLAAGKLILDLKLYAEIEQGRWVVVGDIVHAGLRSTLYDESVSLWGAHKASLRSRSGTIPLVLYPTSMRGIKGFDARTASRIVGFQGDPSTGKLTAVVVETWVGYRAKHRIKRAHERRFWGSLLGRY